MACKFSLPAGASGLVTVTQPQVGSLSQEVSTDKLDESALDEAALDEFALEAFFYDYCVVSTNQSLSRGYLGRVHLRLHRKGCQSDLAKACKVVEYARQSTLLRRPVLMRKAELMYIDLLGSFAKAMDSATFAKSADSLTIAMLLGLYEVFLPQPWSAADPKIDAFTDDCRG